MESQRVVKFLIMEDTEQKHGIDDYFWLNSEMIKSYETLCKKRILERESFIKFVIDNKLNTFHKILFKINKRLIKKVLTQVVCDKRYGVMLYNKIYWQDEENLKA